MATISTPSLSSTPTSSASPVPRRSLRADERRIGLVVWRRVDVPSTRRYQENSGVWLHGDRYCNSTRPSDPPRFICDYCNTVLKPQANASTSNYRRHLKHKHKIILPRTETEEEGVVEEEEEEYTPT